ncbi:UNVERIFIED_CONTAM: hypothetical protein FKN15_034223 [Acipenser sinensis]
MRLLDYFRVMYTVGYSLSLGALTLALAILLSFRKLRCTRNNIHSNLFASFMLRAISILTRDVLLLRQTRELRDHGDPTIMLSNQSSRDDPVPPVMRRRDVGRSRHPPAHCFSAVELRVRNGFVFWYCGSDGQWLINSSGYPLRDFSQCELDDSLRKAQEEQMRLLDYFRVMYTVGYSLSLGALTLAFAILLSFRKLRCTRNNIHSNLFASFMLRAISILTRDVLLLRQTRELRDHGDPTIMLSNQALTGCRLAQVLMQYCVGVNYYWLLVEGLYLHNLLVVMVFSEKSYFRCYLFIGWGTPVLFVVPWVVVRHLYEDTQCWEINENMSYWWIIRCPILVAILINFFIFIQIIHILISKLRAHQMRLAKSTLTLIPLLGIHEVVFALLTEEQAEGTLRNVKFFFELFLNSFQVIIIVTIITVALLGCGVSHSLVCWVVLFCRSLCWVVVLAKSTLTLIPLLGIHEVVFALLTEEQAEGTLRNGLLVAILYCFINKEVQSEIRKKWQRRNLGASLLEEHRNSCSKMPQGEAGKPRAGGTENGHCHHGPLYQSASQQQLDANTESHSSSDNSFSGPQHHHSGARKGKSFCYISTRKQPPKRLDCLPSSISGAGEGSITAQCTESYC